MPISSFSAPSAIAKPGVCTSSTRPASPYEGQVIYETDTDVLSIWNGTAWRILAFVTPTNGSVLQVVSANYSSGELSTTSTTYVSTNLTASITPKSSTSKILVTAHLVAGKDTTVYSGVYVALFRGTVSGTELSSHILSDLDSAATTTGSFSYLDSPATTSSQTYTVGYRSGSGLTTVYAHRNGSQASITLMEIAA